MTNNRSEPATVMALLPAWSAERFIERTLKSLAYQTYPNFRVLISDDASTDATAEICQRIVEHDDRFSLLRQPRNLGWVGNTNALLAASRADFLLFAFHDDVLLPEYVSRCVAALDANPRAVIAHSDIIINYQNSDPKVGKYTRLDGVASRVERAKWVLLRKELWWTPIRGVFRAEAAERIGGLKRHLAGEFAADWPWLVHMALLGESIRIPEILVEKYYQEDSLSLGWNYSPRHWLGAAFSCAREIYQAGLPLREALQLYATLTRRSLPWIKHLAVREARVRG